MPRPPRDPLAGTDRLLIDGSNLLHAVHEATARPTAGPSAASRDHEDVRHLSPATLIGRLRAAVPAGIGIELVLDGPPEPGMAGTRVASGLIVRYSGRRSADHVLLGLVDEARRVAGAGGRIAPRDRHAAVDNLLIVTDDRDLRTALATRGARTAGTHWLRNRLERRRPASPSVGNRRPPASGLVAAGERESEEEGVRWSPGRGATRKRGNPSRGNPSRGHSKPG
jgi:hypothetical protein